MKQAYRAQILHFVDDPAKCGEAACEYFDDGILLVENGRIVLVGPALNLLPELKVPVEHYPHHLIMPGLIDCHVHYPQTEMIGAYGDQLLSWLSHYTFPTEAKFADSIYASEIARIFLDELLRNGTTTALVFGTVHAASVEAFFCEAEKRGLRMIAGKVLMDRNVPAEVSDTVEQGHRESRNLIERWHGVGRLRYAITPRFAPTSSEAQLQSAGELLRKYPDVYLHTHLAENRDEVAWVKTLFPDARNYLDVYDRPGLLGRRSVFAHGVHLCEEERARLSQTDSVIAHCPTSNLFLGSGLFDLQSVQRAEIRVGLGTDVGAGTSFSLFRTLDEAYKIQQLRRHTLDPLHSFYLATLGGAVALDIEDMVGNFARGKEADFIVLDLQATPLLNFRLQHAHSLRDLLFVLQTLGDDRLIARSYALGNCVHQRDGRQRE